MKLFFKIILMSSILISTTALAEDVYNFYFQKAPGPTTVIQGGATKDSDTDSTSEQDSGTPAEAAPSTESPVDAKVATKADTSTTNVSDFYKWEANLGGGQITNSFGSEKATTLGAQYNFSKYVGANLELYFFAQDTTNRYPYETVKTSFMDYSLGVSITPIHADMFGFDFLDLSILIGIMNQRSSNLNGQNFEGIDLPLYSGLGITLNFSKTVGFQTQWKVCRNNDLYGQVSTGLLLRF